MKVVGLGQTVTKEETVLVVQTGGGTTVIVAFGATVDGVTTGTGAPEEWATPEDGATGTGVLTIGLVTVQGQSV